MDCISKINPIESIKSLDELLGTMPRNKIIMDNIIKAWSIINDKGHENISCGISGGSDSDIVLDICFKCDKDKKIKYVFFDTGLEYSATKEHIKYLEQRYGIQIYVCKSHEFGKSIPTSCNEYGQPFLSKQVSEFMYRLQSHGFQWEDDTYENLIEKYHNCKSALAWWCGNKGDGSMFNIEQNRYLKDFILLNNPQFLISNKCCEYAKKKLSKHFIDENNIDLNITGVRKSEGGVRAAAYKNCYTYNSDGLSSHRPIFFYKDEDKKEYEKHFGIIHSDCYTKYGLKRTGCVGCPYGRNFEYELEVLREYEPKLYNAICNVFNDSYEYTRKYREFVSKIKETDTCNQISIFDYMKDL